MRICTIFARNYLAQTRVLALSYSAHNDAEPCVALLLDDPHHSIDDVNEPFEIIRPPQLGLDRFDHLAAMYDVVELAASVKPWLLRHLLERDSAPVAYFDPDIRFFDEIDEITQLTAEKELVLTPRVIQEPVPADDLEPSEATLLASGAMDLAFIAMAPGTAAERVLSWWSDPARFRDFTEDGSHARLSERRFDLVSSVAPNLHVLRDPGANVSYWNLHERKVKREGGRYTVNGRPLRFFHFSGFDPARPFTLSKHQTRVRLAHDPLLAEICDDYVAQLRAQGFEQARSRRWGYERLHDGTALTPLLRSLYAEGDERGAFRFSPFTAMGSEEFVAWCQEPSELGANHGLTRLCLAIYRLRPDLRQAFPDLDGDDGPSLRAWAARHGATEMGLPLHWLPGHPNHPEEGRHEDEDDVWGVNVAGYLRSELGVGEVARAVIRALDARRVPLMPIHGKQIPRSRQGHPFAFFGASSAPFPVNLICVNADHFASFLADAPSQFAEDRYNIGLWWWEVTTFPEGGLEAFELVDEVWVGTDYVGDALRPLSPVPVVKVRVPVTMPPIAPYSRAELGLPDGFVFFFMFDFHSVFERKDPIGLIEAFRIAFDPGAGASLVIKCINHGSDLDNHERLRLAAQTHPDVHVIDRYVPAERKDAMLAACDCYVSLHRAEGFGLPLAEAMYLGKPVIATRFSGNLDFMTDVNSYLVDYEPQPVGEGNYPYPPHAEWAAADRDHAARLMREVFDNPLEAMRRARQGAVDIRRTHSPEAAGETMERRLKTIRAHLGNHPPVRHASSPAQPPPELTQLQELVDRRQSFPQAPKRGRVRNFARRTALRAMAPLIEYQRQISEHEHEVGRGVVRELGRQNAARTAELSQMRRQAGAQVAVLLAELRSREAALRSVSAELAALRSEPEASQAHEGSDLAASPTSPSGDAPDATHATAPADEGRPADDSRDPQRPR
jgi:glycosyltransferase involved in cell wall biosynthesis